MKSEIEKERLKKKYFERKEELDQIRSDLTLKQWKILSENYKIGKKIWGMKFTVVKLAQDMEMPYTTVKRCLSLDRAKKKTWKLIKTNKISAFKAAQVCASKNIHYQDEIVEAIIKDKISTYELKNLKAIKTNKDMNKWRHEVAISKGYSTKDSAYRNFKQWIDRGKLFLIMKKESLEGDKRKEIEQELKNLNKRIEFYIKK